jgi:hypothetical protein
MTQFVCYFHPETGDRGPRGHGPFIEMVKMTRTNDALRSSGGGFVTPECVHEKSRLRAWVGAKDGHQQRALCLKRPIILETRGCYLISPPFLDPTSPRFVERLWRDQYECDSSRAISIKNCCSFISRLHTDSSFAISLVLTAQRLVNTTHSVMVSFSCEVSGVESEESIVVA